MENLEIRQAYEHFMVQNYGVPPTHIIVSVKDYDNFIDQVYVNLLTAPNVGQICYRNAVLVPSIAHMDGQPLAVSDHINKLNAWKSMMPNFSTTEKTKPNKMPTADRLL